MSVTNGNNVYNDDSRTECSVTIIENRKNSMNDVSEQRKSNESAISNSKLHY